MANTVQILEQYWAEHPAWFGRPYGEYLHLGANQEMLRLILQDLSIGKDARVLDLSCALGGNARWIASLYGCKVDGVDAFKPAIAAARQLAKVQGLSDLCTFTTASPSELPFPAGTFDLVVTADDEEHWASVARVVKKGGHVIGSKVEIGGTEALSKVMKKAGFESDKLLDVTRYAVAFYKAKEEEAKLLVEAGLMPASDLLALQMQTLDLYEAGGASHTLFRARRT